ncbi:MAG: glycyl-radical enzyme activating protein [Oscillospiraceae bacterium]|jgi:pyruvate formate lyase activating enzyme|nr:glycyl-radical enzyme activating protein [Oscillospiraceae bacterium]
MEQKQLTGKFYDIQGFSVHDGPGIRLTCFMKGCPLRCIWCHSPESQLFPDELNWMEIKCVGVEKCGRCLDVCPQGAISGGALKKSPAGDDIQLVAVDRAKCDNCGKCAEACTSRALYMCGDDYTVDELMERIRRDVPFFKRSGGGVTVSGGECLCQPEFLLELLKRCKAEDIHTAVDTTGFVPWSVIEPIIPYTDVFLYDIKNMDSDLHKQGTGVPNELILENAKKIAAAGGKFQIRVPVMTMYNDSVEMFDKLGEFLLELGGAVEVIQLLPYHSLGVVKWERLGRGPDLTDGKFVDIVPPTDDLMQARKKQLEDMGLPVIIH